MASYDASEIESKWRKKWTDSKLYEVDLNSDKPKYYNLVMFPYPSGDKLHVGHWYNYAPADSWGRYMRMKGHNVFQPMGFDSFGLPAENYAIKSGVHPRESTLKNVEHMKKQLSDMGAMYDWDKSVTTSEPDYYRWSQWVFLQLYGKDLAYKKTAPVNWCDSCQTVLANEQAQDGTCERCDSEVTKKDLAQWFFKIRDYAEDLLNHDDLDWPEKTVLMQKNWIGKSEGCDIDFKLEDGSETLTCYTTRPDTLFSVTFIVVAPEHPLVDKFVEGTEYEDEVKKMREKIYNQTDIERTSEGGKDKLGAFLGKYAINPANGEKVPVYMANFALMYGTGVVMADAHDQRDFEFAHKYDIPLKFVISEDGKEIDPKDFDEAYVEDGMLFNSGEFSGMNNREALPKMIKWLEENKNGRATINYRLRDWLISRQRYWGAPIPVVYDPEGNPHPVPEEHLPWMLPTDVEFKPTGESPLAASKEFIERTEKIFGKGWRPEVDTMDTFVCSSWYYLRYPCTTMEDMPFDKKVDDKWLPVDMYIGGPEHACMHLLYARFINMALHDMGHIGFKEPFKKLVHQGMVTKDGAKMSKSKGNVVSPDEFIEKYGSDVFRMYLMFMGPFTDGGDWNDKGITGIARFVDRFFGVVSEKSEVKDSKALAKALNKLIKKVSADIERFQFNTCVAAMMEFVNFVMKNGIDDESRKVLVRLIAPLAPHLAEEGWSVLGEKDSIFNSQWPEYDEKLVVDDTVVLGVQVNGKVRGEVEIGVHTSQENALEIARLNPNVSKYLEEGKVVKEIYVPGKIIGFVVK
ncbi:leucine--tRNA ligase [Candidatus Peregrinibacteria bacterium]|jgi:leucyl-tRNA synthetase|nr:leucine--tRNA ligase [Candidatus Peregrinibacteria bacterium]